MENTIKYRGRNKNGVWAYGSLYVGKHVQFGEYALIFEESDTTTDKHLDNRNAVVFPIDEVKVVQPNTIGMFVGVCDQNGKEVYEGDILLIEDGEGEEYVSEVRKYGEIDYITQDTDYDLLSWVDGFISFEVIGNIYDNPELLKK